jgi:hypothetical protein
MNKKILILFLILGLTSMAAVKVPDLTPITTPAGNDELYIVDVSDTTDGVSGSGRKIDWSDLHSSGQNAKYVGCSDSIATAITNATAGDKLILGNCDYTLSSTININKAMNIQCSPSTRLLDGTAFTGPMLNVTAAPFSIKNCSFVYDSGAANPITVDASAGNVFNYKDVVIDNIRINGTVTTSTYAIIGIDAGMTVINPYIDISGAHSGTSQCSTIFTKVLSSAEANVEVWVINGGYHRCALSTSASSAVNKPLFCWNNGADESPNSITCNYVNQVVRADNSVANAGITMAALVEGNRATGNFFSGVLDGGKHGTSSNARDLQTDGGASVANLYGTVLRRGYKLANTGTINVYGVIQGDGIYAKAVNQTPDHLSAIPLIDMIGAQGGNKPGTGATLGLNGGGVTITSGSAGSATEATTTATGGVGGAFVYTSGNGGSETISTSVTNVGGAGGAITLKTGAGGAANSASTTNTGGNGGDFILDTGAGGTGTTTSGNNGSIIFKVNAAEKARVHTNGNFGVGDTTPDSFFSVGASSQFGIDSIGNLTTSGTIKSTRTTDVGWSVVNVTNQACNTTCTNACVVGTDSATPGFLTCADATADSCLCAGAN